MSILTVGSSAPAFTLADDDEVNHSLADYAGKWVVLYFYPRDDTPGCTKEACDFRYWFEDITKKNAVVIGVSKDSPESHAKFLKKYKLPFILLADEDHAVMEAYGAWQEKSMYGKKYMGIQRMTYLIDPEGKIAKVYEKVEPEGHAKEILEELRASS